MAAFNKDTFIKGELQKLIKQFGVKTIVETGTFHGASTLEFITIVKNVFTLECNSRYFQEAKPRLEKAGIITIKGDSSHELASVIKGKYGQFHPPALFYLDAHWYRHNPLLDELRILAMNKMNKCSIAIHDFKVPGKKFGYDRFHDGTEYTYEFIKKSVDKIYGVNKYKYHYNEKANGACRGIIFIYPAGT